MNIKTLSTNGSIEFDANAWNGHSTWHFLQDFSQRNVLPATMFVASTLVDGYMYPKASIQKYLGHCFEEKELMPFKSVLIMHLMIQFLWGKFCFSFSSFVDSSSLTKTGKLDHVASWTLNSLSLCSCSRSEEHAMKKTRRGPHLPNHPHRLQHLARQTKKIKQRRPFIGKNNVRLRPIPFFFSFLNVYFRSSLIVNNFSASTRKHLLKMQSQLKTPLPKAWK